MGDNYSSSPDFIALGAFFFLHKTQSVKLEVSNMQYWICYPKPKAQHLLRKHCYILENIVFYNRFEERKTAILSVLESINRFGFIRVMIIIS